MRFSPLHAIVVAALSAGFLAGPPRPATAQTPPPVQDVLGDYQQRRDELLRQAQAVLAESQSRLDVRRSDAQAAFDAAIDRARAAHHRTVTSAVDAWSRQQKEANRVVLAGLDRLITAAEQRGELVEAQRIRGVRAQLTQDAVALAETMQAHASAPSGSEGVPSIATGNVAAWDRGARAVVSHRSSLNGAYHEKQYANFWTPGFMVVTLDKPYLLERIRMRLWDYEPRTYTYSIETSVDGVHYESASDERTGSSWQELSFTPRAVRYIRIHGLGCSEMERFHILTVEAFCPPPAPTPAAPEDAPEASAAAPVEAVLFTLDNDTAARESVTINGRPVDEANADRITEYLTRWTLSIRPTDHVVLTATDRKTGAVAFALFDRSGNLRSYSHAGMPVSSHQDAVKPPLKPSRWEPADAAESASIAPLRSMEGVPRAMPSDWGAIWLSSSDTGRCGVLLQSGTAPSD